MTPEEAKEAVTAALLGDLKVRLERRLRQEAEAIIRQAMANFQDLVRARAESIWDEMTDDVAIRVQIERKKERA